ncbi:MAG: hypothetical protein NT154_18225 [Verrucomicrobia bacterium]|nr:hypothetical protein [Verrucomicrobiota bacterium]
MSAMRTCTLGILSDIHYACAAEQARGDDYELRGIPNPVVRILAHLYRHYIWLRQPLRKNYLLDQFLEHAAAFDYVIANGDYSCNSAFVGLSDDAACQSARECVEKLRQRFGANLRTTFGDHELGKLSMFGGNGGMRLASWRRAQEEVGLQPFWRLEIGSYVLLGIVSTLLALPVFYPDMLPAERPEWERLRAEHLAEIRRAFEALQPGQRVLLFLHDPTALPFLWREESVRAKLSQIEQTTIGHLHTNLVLWKSRLLAGMPPIRFLGHTVERMSIALSQARYWRPFHVRLCPSLAGVELLKDGGYCTLELDPEARRPASFRFHHLHRR